VNDDRTLPDQSEGSARPRPRARRVSRSRQMFLNAIGAQITGTRVLALLTIVVLVGGGAFWLLGTSGSPVIGIYFIVLAGVLLGTVYWFIRVMFMFTGRRRPPV
jgi:hypothetical protein